MLVELIYFQCVLAEQLPCTTTASPILSAQGQSSSARKLDFSKHCKLEFGAYVQAHEDHDNTMATRTTGAIALRPTGNAQGGYFLYQPQYRARH
jgi:hypothetical protein